MAKIIGEMTPETTPELTPELKEQLIKEDQKRRRIQRQKARHNGECKSAAESAYWYDKLVNANIELARALLAKTKIPEQFMKIQNPTGAKKAEKKNAEQEKVEFRVYWAKVHTHEVVPFDSKDIAKERADRMKENNDASRQLGHPAMKAALAWSEGSVFEAACMLNLDNPAELGCKWIFQGIEYRKDALIELDDQLKELEDKAESSRTFREEMTEKIKECRKFGAYNDFLSYVDVIDIDKEWFRGIISKIHAIKRQKREIKNEMKVLNAALRDIRHCANTTELALIDANTKVYAKRARAKREGGIGRPINMVDKPMLKGYKMMNFKATSVVAQFGRMINKIDVAAMNCQKIDHDDLASDDEKEAAINNLKKIFEESINELRTLRDSGAMIKLSDENARIHNARQSLLSDVIGVPYGKTTDMIITFSHNVAKIFNDVVGVYLDDDAREAENKLRDFMATILDIATVNGIDLEMHTEDGRVGHIRYKFWNANNSKLKVGEATALSLGAYRKAAEAGRAGMTEEEFNEMWTNGSDMLKYWSYASTPGCPLMYDGKPITCNDVLVVDSIDTIRWFRNVLEFDDNGNRTKKDKAPIPRTAYDGQMFFLVPIPSQQLRGAMAFKGFGVNCAHADGTTIIDEIAAREGWKIPEYIRDVDGVMRKWRDYKIICTKDAWKFAGWKFGGNDIGSAKKFTYAEYCERMNKLAEKYPTVNVIYTARIADATEESKRRLTRQSMQQFIFATHLQLEKLYAKSLGKLQKWSTQDGIIRVLAGLDKEENQRTAFEHLIEACPEMLDHPLLKRFVEDLYNRKVAEAAVRPEVTGIYPYIAEDPVAFFKIVLWGKNPNEIGLGYLNAKQVNAPNTAEGKEMYLVRYPNNYICGRCRTNHNDDIYRDVGNVLVLSLDGGLLIIADGDTDGDEFCVIFDEVVVEMMHDTMREVNPPIVHFPHPKLAKRIIRDAKERAHELSKAMTVANIYGPAVGQNSNKATKYMHRAAINYMEWQKTEDVKRFKAYKYQLQNAIVAHIAAIIAIDLAKTGEMPAWLDGLLQDIESHNKKMSKKMPWNQRFVRDTKTTPWFSDEWDKVTTAESDSVCDRGPRYLIDAANAVGYKAPMGDGFDIHSILGSKEGLDARGVSAKLENKKLRALEARNYRSKDNNNEGDNEFKLIMKMKSKNDEDKIGTAELVRFLWRNQASLVYTLSKSEGDRIENAIMTNGYYDFVHDLLIDFGSYKPAKEKFALDADFRRKSNIYYFLDLAFSESNGIGKDLRRKFVEETDDMSDEDRAKVQEHNAKIQYQIDGLRASFAMFIIKVFAYDLYEMVCEQKHIAKRWYKPVEVVETEDEAEGFYVYDDCDEGSYYADECEEECVA